MGREEREWIDAWGVGARGHGGATEVVAGPLSQPQAIGEVKMVMAAGEARGAAETSSLLAFLLSLPNSLLVEFIGFLIDGSGITSPFS